MSGAHNGELLEASGGDGTLTVPHSNPFPLVTSLPLSVEAE